MATREEKAAELAREEEDKANWPIHHVRITQVYRVECSIIVAIKAPDGEKAVEWVASDEAPSDTNPRWKRDWDLQNEEHEIVK